jgi:FKBP-type peptidyl-prolyl cis-trans isomerase SlpA
MSAHLKAGPGTVVTVAYTAQLKNGQNIDLPGQPSPLRFKWGTSKVWTSLQSALRGTQPKQELVVRVQPENAYGKRVSRNEIKVKRSKLSPETELFPGKRLVVRRSGKENQEYFVTDIQPEYVLLENNHPLADEEITLKLVVLEVTEDRKKQPAEQV